MEPETMTLVLVNLAGIMERTDESLLPNVFKEVGAALHTDPKGLSQLTLYRSIGQSACYPLAVYLSARHNRTHVIALGAILWAAAIPRRLLFHIRSGGDFKRFEWGWTEPLSRCYHLSHPGLLQR